MSKQFTRIEDTLEQYIAGDELAEVKRILYGPDTPYVFVCFIVI